MMYASTVANRPRPLSPFLASSARGLGDAQKAAVIEGAVATGLMTAAHFDPEPISKVVLYAAAALTGLVAKLFHGCGATCVAASQIVDQIEPALAGNLAAYRSGPRTTADQQYALQAFDYAWSEVVNACSNPALGEAGRKCISERGPNGRPSWGANWFELYRDPIATDVPSDHGSISGVASAVWANPDLLLSNPDYSGWLLPAGLLLAGVLL